MKSWLYASLLLNLALGSLSGLLLTQNPTETGPTPIQTFPVKPEIKPAPAPKPFQWSQLESEDFPVYVANLRSIGCPEATIHDIVAAELKEIYDEKRRTIAAGAATRRAIEAEQGKLTQEENAVVARALGTASATPGAAARTAGGAGPALGRAPRVVYPTIFQNPGGLLLQTPGSAAGLNTSFTAGAAPVPKPILTPEQSQAVQQLQQEFVQDIGGPNQNPADPAYLKRWQKAQKESEDRLRAQIGWQALRDYQIALENQTGTNSNSVK